MGRKKKRVQVAFEACTQAAMTERAMSAQKALTLLETACTLTRRRDSLMAMRYPAGAEGHPSSPFGSPGGTHFSDLFGRTAFH